MSVVITDKKFGDIQMSIDNKPMNPGMKRTKYHVATPQEIGHDLKEATVFSKMDMGWGFHQLELDETSKTMPYFKLMKASIAWSASTLVPQQHLVSSTRKFGRHS